MFGLNKKGKGAVTISKTITAAGTAEQISTSHLFCKYIEIQADKTNTSGYICVGDSNVVHATELGKMVAKGNTYRFEGEYLDNIYVDVGTNGDKATITYEEVHTVT